ncbi:MAG: hypothetical protein V4629_02990 [Pseudomonadota bacterium]
MGCASPEKEKPGKYEVEMQNQAMDKWKRTKTAFAPVREDLMQEASNLRNPNTIQTGVNKTANVARENVQRYQPVPMKNTGALGNMVAQHGLMGATQAGAMQKGLATMDDRYASAVDSIVRVGRGIEGNALQGLSQAASNEAGNQAADVARKNSFNNSMMEGAGALAGAYGYSKFNAKAPGTPNTFTTPNQMQARQSTLMPGEMYS